MDERFAGKVAVVTGAGSGIGRALAVRFSTLGMHLVLADVDEDGMADTGAALSGAVERLTVRTDVARADEVDALAAAATARFGGIDVLCNNAGVLGPAGDPVWQVETHEWSRVLSVNLFGVIHGIRAFVPGMIVRDRPAHIVNTASMAGLTTSPLLPSYGASKHAVVALTETLALQLARRRSPISVSLLCPGPVRTNLVAHEQAAAGLPRVAPSDLAREAAGGSFQELAPADVAEAVVAAIAAKRFYIFPNEGSRSRIEHRTSAIMDAL